MRNNVINVFVKTMKENGIGDSFYSFNGYKEGASCVVQDGIKYTVFDAERARRNNERSFETIKEACLEVIKRFTFDDEDCNFLVNRFNENLKEEKLYEV